MEAEPRVGSGLSGGRGLQAEAPPPRQSLPAGGKASGRRRRFQNKEMRRGAQGTGVERKAEEVRLLQPGYPLPLQLARGNSPHPQPGLRRRRGRGRRLRSAAVFQFTFADSGRERERPLRCPASLHRTQLRAPRPLCPCGWAEGRASQSVRKRAERSEPTPQLGDRRSERAAAAPPLRSLFPA